MPSGAARSVPEPAGRPGLCPRAVHAAWGWRFEAALLLAVVVGVRLCAVVGPGGPVLYVGVVVLFLWRCPRLRHRLASALRAAALRRRFVRALHACRVAGPFGLPVVGQVRDAPCGFRVVVRVPLGTHSELLEKAAPLLAAALRVREVRAVRHADDASLATVHVVARDPFAGPPLPWPWHGTARSTLWQPVPLGVDEDGGVVAVSLPEHNMLLGGEPGGGKSAALSLLVAAAALDPSVELALFDAKQVELAPWAPCARASCGPEVGQAVEIFEGLRAEMDRRYEHLLAADRRKVAATDGLGLFVVAIDELAFFLRGGTREERRDFAEGLRDLVARGRAAGIIVAAATQKPSHDVVPTAVRDLFSFRLALRCTTPEASDTVLGQGWASRGYSAATIETAARGVGYLLAEGALPVKCRSYYLDDAALSVLARRAAALRAPR